MTDSMLRRLSQCVLVSFASLTMVACAPVEPQPIGEGDASYEDPYSAENVDPLEPLNRGIFAFNRGVDVVVIKPVTQLYRGIVPEVGRKGVSNFLSNLSSPVVFLNSVLQGDPEQSFTTLWRFLLNSTLGVGGLFDFAGYYGIQNRQEDFGQTMGHYGVGSGAYIVLPFIGPSSARDVVGRVVDVVSDPLTWTVSDGWLYARTGATVIDTRSRNFDVIEDIFKNSVDPYATIRTGYLQKRAADVQDMNSPFKHESAK